MADAPNLPEQIYRRPTGYQVVVRLGGRQLTKRYPLTTPIATMETKRDEFRIELRHAAESVASGATLPRLTRTFADDCETYLVHLRKRVAAGDLHPTSLDGFERYLDAWCVHFGGRPRAEIKTREFSDRLAAFESEGVVREAPLGPETVNKVRLAALGLYAGHEHARRARGRAQPGRRRAAPHAAETGGPRDQL